MSLGLHRSYIHIIGATTFSVLYFIVCSIEVFTVRTKYGVTASILRSYHIFYEDESNENLKYRASLLLEAPNYCPRIQSNSAGFSFVNTGKQVHLKQTAFRTEFGEIHAPSKCCIQKLVKKLETRGSRSNAFRLLSLGPTEGQSVQKYTPHNRTTQRRYTLRDSSRQRPQFWEKYSRIWRNIFKWAWMWKETSFSIYYEQVLFFIVPGICI